MLPANKKSPIRQSDEEIDNILRHELFKINGWDNKKRLEYISKRKVLRKFQNQNIYSNGVFLLDNFFVAKKLHNNMNGYVFWKNEINSLKRIVGNIYFPQLVAADPRNLIIYMTYCGKTVENIPRPPVNWKQQVNEIKQILLKKQLNPNDILPRNVCCLNGVIKLIDFGLSNARYSEIITSINKLNRLFSV